MSNIIEDINEEINALRGSRNDVLRAVSFLKGEFPHEDLIPQVELDKLDIVDEKLCQCYGSTVEITERDMAMDLYWDKKEQNDALLDYATSLEQSIRRQVLLSAMREQVNVCLRYLHEHDNADVRESYSGWWEDLCYYAQLDSDDRYWD